MMPPGSRLISDTVRYLRSKKREVVYDAEHFFDGYKANPDYALKTLAAAAEAGGRGDRKRGVDCALHG